MKRTGLAPAAYRQLVSQKMDLSADKIVSMSVGAGGLLIAFYTLVVNRRSVFRNSLQTRQLEDVSALRRELFEIFVRLRLLKNAAEGAKLAGWSIEDIKEKSPDDWRLFEEYKRNSMEVFYRLAFDHYYLLPKWIDREELRELRASMESFVPFTLASLLGRPFEDIQKHQTNIAKAIDYLDSRLAKQG